MSWRPVTPTEPPDGQLVEVPNNGGAKLRRSGNLWFLPDHEVYVYYSPTEWRPVATVVELDMVIERRRKLDAERDVVLAEERRLTNQMWAER